jgi:hypothetical protein
MDVACHSCRVKCFFSAAIGSAAVSRQVQQQPAVRVPLLSSNPHHQVTMAARVAPGALHLPQPHLNTSSLVNFQRALHQMHTSAAQP